MFLGFRVQGLGFRFLGFRVQGLGFTPRMDSADVRFSSAYGQFAKFGSLFRAPKIVRRPCKRTLKRDPNLENYP